MLTKEVLKALYPTPGDELVSDEDFNALNPSTRAAVIIIATNQQSELMGDSEEASFRASIKNNRAYLQ